MLEGMLALLMRKREEEVMFHLKRKRRGKKRGRRRKSTRRRAVGIRAAVGLSLTPSIRVTLKRKKRRLGEDKHFDLTGVYTLLFLVCLLALRVCACPYRQQATSLGSHFTWLDDLQSPTDQPFCVDCKPDQANWTYKSLYRGDIAR